MATPAASHAPASINTSRTFFMPRESQFVIPAEPDGCWPPRRVATVHGAAAQGTLENHHERA